MRAQSFVDRDIPNNEMTFVRYPICVQKLFIIVIVKILSISCVIELHKRKLKKSMPELIVILMCVFHTDAHMKIYFLKSRQYISVVNVDNPNLSNDLTTC